MGTQGPGRKRIPNREKLTAEDDALDQIAREAEARLAAKRAARAEARDIRMKELERQQKEMSDDEERMSVGSRGSFRVEERPERDFLDKGSRTASTLSAATLASLGGASSRRGSCDTSFSVETEASIRDLKDSLSEAEEKYRRAMVSNAQLHNEKAALMYQVDTLREELNDLEEELWETRRHGDDSRKELERERQAHGVLQFNFKEMKETMTHTEELLTALERHREMSDIVRIDRDRLRVEVFRLSDLLKKHGVFVTPELSANGEAGETEGEDAVGAEAAVPLAQETSPDGRTNLLGNVPERRQTSTTLKNASSQTRSDGVQSSTSRRDDWTEDVETKPQTENAKHHEERPSTSLKHLHTTHALLAECLQNKSLTSEASETLDSICRRISALQETVTNMLDQEDAGSHVTSRKLPVASKKPPERSAEGHSSVRETFSERPGAESNTEEETSSGFLLLHSTNHREALAAPAGQRSKVKRLLERTANELMVTILPELPSRARDGRRDETARSNAGVSAGDMDSCEEAMTTTTTQQREDEEDAAERGDRKQKTECQIS